MSTLSRLNLQTIHGLSPWCVWVCVDQLYLGGVFPKLSYLAHLTSPSVPVIGRALAALTSHPRTWPQFSFLLTNSTGKSLFFRCPVKADDPIPCGNGSFAPEGSTYCHGCPIGSQCPSAKLAYHQLCANGSYSLVVNATSCLECPPGFKCPNPNVEPVECENGTYSKAGATHCVICPGGHR